MADEEKTYYEPKFYGKPFKRAEEIPAPPPFNVANAWKVIGPGFIVLSLSIGSGEWLMGSGKRNKLWHFCFVDRNRWDYNASCF